LSLCCSPLSSLFWFPVGLFGFLSVLVARHLCCMGCRCYSRCVCCVSAFSSSAGGLRFFSLGFVAVSPLFPPLPSFRSACVGFCRPEFCSPSLRFLVDFRLLSRRFRLFPGFVVVLLSLFLRFRSSSWRALVLAIFFRASFSPMVRCTAVATSQLAALLLLRRLPACRVFCCPARVFFQVLSPPLLYAPALVIVPPPGIPRASCRRLPPLSPYSRSCLSDASTAVSVLVSSSPPSASLARFFRLCPLLPVTAALPFVALRLWLPRGLLLRSDACCLPRWHWAALLGASSTRTAPRRIAMSLPCSSLPLALPLPFSCCRPHLFLGLVSPPRAVPRAFFLVPAASAFTPAAFAFCAASCGRLRFWPCCPAFISVLVLLPPCSPRRSLYCRYAWRVPVSRTPFLRLAFPPFALACFSTVVCSSVATLVAPALPPSSPVPAPCPASVSGFWYCVAQRLSVVSVAPTVPALRLLLSPRLFCHFPWAVRLTPPQPPLLPFLPASPPC